MNVHKNARLTPVGRELLVKRVLFEKASVREVSLGMRVSPQTVRKWVQRYRRLGAGGLVDRSSRPKRSPSRLPERLVRRIAQLRRRRWTGLRIAESLALAVSTVGLWLRRLGLERLSKLEPKPVVVRYERSRPGELVHLDAKKLGCIGQVGKRINGDPRTRVRGVGWEVLHICIDDATRVAYAEIGHPGEGAQTVTDFLKRAVAWFREQGVWVERVMTDNGPGYRSHRFREAIEGIGARHIRTQAYRPQTNGKAERFIQTALREWAYAAAYRNSWARSAALPGFLNRYNRLRPHRALANQSPLSRLESLLVNNNVLVPDI